MGWGGEYIALAAGPELGASCPRKGYNHPMVCIQMDTTLMYPDTLALRCSVLELGQVQAVGMTPEHSV